MCYLWKRLVFFISFYPSASFLVSSSAWDVRARWILGILMVLIGELWYFLTEQLLQVREGGDVEGVMAWGSLGVLGTQPVPRREPTRLVQTRVAVSRTLVTRFPSAPGFGFRSTSGGCAVWTTYSEPWGSASAGSGQDHDVPGFLLFPLKKHRSLWLIHERWSYYKSSLLRMRLSKIFTPLNMIRKLENTVFGASPKWGYLRESHSFYLEIFIHRNQIPKITRDTRWYRS